MFSLGLQQVCGSGDSCLLHVIHPNLISLLTLAPLGTSWPLTASPQDDEPPGCFSPPSIPWQGGILGKSHPSSAVAAHLPPTLQPGAACLPAPSLGCFDPGPVGSSPPGCLDIPPRLTGHPWASPDPLGNHQDRPILIQLLHWGRVLPRPEWALPPDRTAALGPTHALSMVEAKP